MKHVKFCKICGEPVANSLTYQVEVEREITNPITGEFRFEVVGGVMCPGCNERMGFKTSAKKLEKWKGGILIKANEKALANAQHEL